MNKKLFIVMVDNSCDFNNPYVRMAKPQAFTVRETADFVKNGMEMFKDKGSQQHFYVQEIELVDQGVEEYLGSNGLGPKAKKGA